MVKLHRWANPNNGFRSSYFLGTMETGYRSSLLQEETK